MKNCPICAESIQDAAIKCRFCGHAFTPATKTPSKRPVSSVRYLAGPDAPSVDYDDIYKHKASSFSPSKAIGLALVAVGVVLLFFFAFVYDTTVQTEYGRVHNIGLISNRNVGIGVSCMVAVIGTIFCITKSKKQTG